MWHFSHSNGLHRLSEFHGKPEISPESVENPDYIDLTEDATTGAEGTLQETPPLSVSTSPVPTSDAEEEELLIPSEEIQPPRVGISTSPVPTSESMPILTSSPHVNVAPPRRQNPARKARP